MTDEKSLYHRMGDRLAEVLMDRLNNEPSPTELNVIRQFLKDQGVVGLQLNQGKIHHLLESMPFMPELDHKIRKPRSDSA